MKKCLSIITGLLLLTTGQAQKFDVDTLSMKGSIDNMINVVFLPDGYTENELEKFIEDAHWMMDALFGKQPYPAYRGYFNCFAIKVPSEVSGAANDPDSLINNYFGSTFNTSGIWRLVVPQRSDRVQSVLQNNLPQYDQVVMIVNDSRYGGSGGWIATSTTHVDGPEICIHELGHSFGGLSDEYWAGPQYARENINMTQDTDPGKVRWKNWMGYRSVGIYAHSESPTWYRPHQNCEMRYLNSQFCSVCREAIVDRILDLVNPVIDYFPNEGNFILYNQDVDFSVRLLKPEPSTMSIRWTLNADSIGSNRDSIHILSTQLIPGDNKVVAFILDTTQFIRNSMHSRVHLNKVIWDFSNAGTGIQPYEIHQQKFNFDIYPNPVSDFLQISWTLDIPSSIQYRVLSIEGKELYRSAIKDYQLGRFTETIDLRNVGLSKGIHYLQIQVDDQPFLFPLLTNL